MEDELVDWWNVFANAAVSFLVAVIVGVIIRFKLKPKHEKIFEHNYSEEIKKLFNQLHFFDFHYTNFHEILTDEMGEIPRNRTRITPEGTTEQLLEGGVRIVFNLQETQLRIKWRQSVQDRLQYDLQHMQTISEAQRKDYARVLSTIENYFLNYVSDYINDTYQWSKAVIEDYQLSHLLEKRQENAGKIIEFVKKNKLLDLTDRFTDEFITKWENS